jgi:maltose phosphorylase
MWCGVTGPNEYENNVNNNCFSIPSLVGAWYTRNAGKVRSAGPGVCRVVAKTNFADKRNQAVEEIGANMYFPYDETRNLILQQEGYLDKEQTLARDLDVSQRPINQHWSWDRILRSPFIKQADTLQGIYLFEEKYDTEFIKRHFEFYEARTVHESSLSPCIHAVLAARIGKVDQAYELYLRTSRLDLDDFNREVDEGLCHIVPAWRRGRDGIVRWVKWASGFSQMLQKLFLNLLIHEKWQNICSASLPADQAPQVSVEVRNT